jgi:ABC-2 type transport system ATP-binding protein
MTTAPSPAVLVSDLHKAFGTNQVLRGVNFEVAKGSVFALLGSNGAGKTTTVSVLTTLLRPDSGTAQVAGIDVLKSPARARELITATGQSTSVDLVLTGLENLVLVARLRHLPRPKPVAQALLDQFDLAEAAGRRVGTYSGGMKRRLDIAMSLVGSPQVVFLDEPTTGLDPAARREVWQVIQAMAGSGVTIMLTTQHMEEAAHLANQIAVLHGGRITANGSHEAILAAGEASNLEDAFLNLTSVKEQP